jgi:hypothetical protein
MGYQFTDIPIRDTQTVVNAGGLGMGSGFGGSVLGGALGGLLGRLFGPMYGGGSYGHGMGHGCDGGGFNSVRQAIDTTALLQGQNRDTAEILESINNNTQFKELQSALAALGLQLNANAREAAECCCENGKAIIALGKDGIISGLQQTISFSDKLACTNAAIAEAAREAAECCCDTKLRDLQNTNSLEKQMFAFKVDTDAKLCDLQTLIIAQGKDARITSLEERLADRDRAEIVGAVNATTRRNFDLTNSYINQLGANDKFINPTVVWPPVSPLSVY